jgi:membrane protease YdiL (CAAX protease family)
MSGDEEQRQRDGILTSGESAATFGALVGVVLALIEYQILANPALIPSYSLVELVELSVVMIFVVTLVEELLFRALLQPELVQRSGPIVGILITSIIFGAR